MFPFCLSSTSIVFSKVTAVVKTQLWQMGILIFPYLDNQVLVKIAMTLFHSLDLQQSIRKSILSPVNQRDLIGIFLNGVAARAYLPADRFMK